MFEFFLLRKQKLYSALTPDTCAARLEGAIESTFDIVPTDGGLAGMSGSDWARLKRRRFFQNSFAPVLVLSFGPSNGGTRIETAIGPGLFTRSFVILWSLGVASTMPWALWPHPAFIMGGLMIGFMVVLAAGGALMGRADEAWLLTHVSQLLDARPADTAKSRV